MPTKRDLIKKYIEIINKKMNDYFSIDLFENVGDDIDKAVFYIQTYFYNCHKTGHYDNVLNDIFELYSIDINDEIKKELYPEIKLYLDKIFTLL